MQPYTFDQLSYRYTREVIAAIVSHELCWFPHLDGQWRSLYDKYLSEKLMLERVCKR